LKVNVQPHTAGSNYGRQRHALAGKLIFFRDGSVIKDGHYGSLSAPMGKVCPPRKRTAILADVNDHPEQHVTRYFEDYVPGLTVDCGTFSVSETEIVAFATEYDPQPFHVDPVRAKDGPFGGLIASGWQTTSLMMRLLVEHFVSPESGLGAAGVDEVRWPRPVRPGDTLHVLATVLEARRSNSKPDRGIVRSLAEVTNQNGELVLKLTAINFILAREAS
jgi:acyl dehydratase